MPLPINYVNLSFIGKTGPSFKTNPPLGGLVFPLNDKFIKVWSFLYFSMKRNICWIMGFPSMIQIISAITTFKAILSNSRLSVLQMKTFLRNFYHTLEH